LLIYRLWRFIFAKNSNSLPPVNRIGTPFIQLNQVDSTNNYAMGQVQAHLAEHGSTYFAWHQSGGKGQRGKSWKTSAGLNLTMSVVVNPAPLTINNQFYLSMVAALACADFVEKQVLHDVSIKWPNDIYWKDRKAGGILIENVINAKAWKYAIIGMGINVNQVVFEGNIPNPVSIKQVTGKTFELLPLANSLCLFLEKRWEQLMANDYAGILNQYNDMLYKAGEIVHFKMDNAIFDARVIRVNEMGELLVDTGSVTALPFGSVQWIIS
jgi:BirA family transcriptional regulator, biotin operon repressor / biotin---[acetyl-CoA-carboxylase] ligase